VLLVGRVVVVVAMEVVTVEVLVVLLAARVRRVQRDLQLMPIRSVIFILLVQGAL